MVHWVDGGAFAIPPGGQGHLPARVIIRTGLCSSRLDKGSRASCITVRTNLVPDAGLSLLA
jgi:hypothetical protein